MGLWQSFVATMKDRKIGQMVVVYLGSAWVLLEAFSFFQQRYEWPARLFDLFLVVVIFGLPIALVFRWFQPTQGKGRGNGRLILLNGLLAVLMVMTSYFIYKRKGSDGAVHPSILEKSVVVMPFVNLNRDVEQEYFSDGITEDIISRLGKIADLHVTSRTSAYAYKDSPKNIHQIATELSVAYVVEGSIQKNANSVRVTARLIKAESDRNIWTETYDKPVADIFAMQTDLAEKIATALQARITEGERNLINKIPTKSTIAYQYYQQGRYFLSQAGKQNMMRARDLFAKAISEDVEFALAYTGLAESYMAFVDFGYASPITYSDSTLSPLQKALSYDASLGEAYSGLAVYHLYMHHFEQAETAAMKAIELSPGDEFGYYHYATLCAATQRLDKAIDLISKAQTISPLSSKLAGYKVQFLFWDGREKEGIAEAKRALTLFPDDDFILWAMATGLTQMQQYKEAIELFRNRKIDEQGTNWALGYAYAKSGEHDKAMQIISFLNEKSKNTYVPPTFIGLIYLALGEKETAISYFEKGFAQKDTFSIFFNVHPWFAEARDDARFKAMLSNY